MQMSELVRWGAGASGPIGGTETESYGCSRACAACQEVQSPNLTTHFHPPTPGAGDCFTATYAVAVLEGKAPAEALQFASAAASICVQRKGAMPSLPARTEVDELLSKQ